LFSVGAIVDHWTYANSFPAKKCFVGTAYLAVRKGAFFII